MARHVLANLVRQAKTPRGDLIKTCLQREQHNARFIHPTTSKYIIYTPYTGRYMIEYYVLSARNTENEVSTVAAEREGGGTRMLGVRTAKHSREKMQRAASSARLSPARHVQARVFYVFRAAAFVYRLT